MLLAAGADMCAKSLSGETPRECAVSALFVVYDKYAKSVRNRKNKKNLKRFWFQLFFH